MSALSDLQYIIKLEMNDYMEEELEQETEILLEAFREECKDDL